MTVGAFVLAVSGVGFAAAIAGVRSGRSLASWTAILAVAGGGLAAGALLLQDDPGLASWLIAPPLTGGLGVANIRSLFAGDGPLRT
ncbi:MAG: hypothetical protein ACRDGK_02920 [Actinomycetota bacterium]